jgi:hypothetical protein
VAREAELAEGVDGDVQAVSRGAGDAARLGPAGADQVLGHEGLAGTLEVMCEERGEDARQRDARGELDPGPSCGAMGERAPRSIGGDDRRAALEDTARFRGEDARCEAQLVPAVCVLVCLRDRASHALLRVRARAR